MNDTEKETFCTRKTYKKFINVTVSTCRVFNQKDEMEKGEKQGQRRINILFITLPIHSFIV